MENIQPRVKKKKDKKPIYILASFLLFFSIFVYLITRPSQQSKALKELESSFSKKDVEMVWYKYKSDLYQDEDFLFETRTKLNSFNLSEKEIEDCKSWLPPAQTSINLIIIPDLSSRIIDTINNPKQIDNDIFVLNTIWKSFEEYSKLKQDTKDKLIVDVTDIDQAKGQFSRIANNLQFDLSVHKDKSNRLFFTPEKDDQFKNSVIQMYNSAKQKPLGANYRFYFRRYLASHLKKSTLFDNYINKIIIITDGYLEYQNPLNPAEIISDTKIYHYKNILYPAVQMGNVLDVITSNGLNILNAPVDLSNSQIFLCEVNERKSGKSFDFEILKIYWTDWLQRMGAKKENIFINPHDQASDDTAKKINKFISET